MSDRYYKPTYEELEEELLKTQSELRREKEISKMNSVGDEWKTQRVKVLENIVAKLKKENEALKTKNKHRNLYKPIVWTTLLLVAVFLHACAINMINDPMSYISIAITAYKRIRIVQNGMTLLILSYPLLVTCIVNLILLTPIKEIVKIKHKERCYKRINRLHTYYESGAITEEEFNKLKDEILRKIN